MRRAEFDGPDARSARARANLCHTAKVKFEGHLLWRDIAAPS